MGAADAIMGASNATIDAADAIMGDADTVFLQHRDVGDTLHPVSRHILGNAVSYLLRHRQKARMALCR